jgi:hypothetical protein
MLKFQLFPLQIQVNCFGTLVNFHSKLQNLINFELLKINLRHQVEFKTQQIVCNFKKNSANQKKDTIF